MSWLSYYSTSKNTLTVCQGSPIPSHYAALNNNIKTHPACGEQSAYDISVLNDVGPYTRCSFEHLPEAYIVTQTTENSLFCPAMAYVIDKVNVAGTSTMCAGFAVPNNFVITEKISTEHCAQATAWVITKPASDQPTTVRWHSYT